MGLLVHLENFLHFIGSFALVLFGVLKHVFFKKHRWKIVQAQLYEMSVASLPVVALTGFSTGLVLAAQSFYQLSDKGLSSATGIMVGKAMLTELGPILTAFMLTGRVGAAMCAEIGSMKVSDQIAAMESMSVHPFHYLLAPRYISCVIMTPLLTLFSIVLGIFGGYLLSVYGFKMASSDFLSPIAEYMTTFDLLVGLIKSVIFGLVIVSISCYMGLQTSGGAQGVGKATTSSVVQCYSYILLLNFFLTVSLNVFRVSLGGG